MWQITDYEIEMTWSAFQTLVQFEQAHLCMTYTTDGVSRHQFRLGQMA